MSPVSRRVGRTRPTTRPLRGLLPDDTDADGPRAPAARPTTAHRRRSPSRMVSSRSSTSTAPFSIATPARPAAAARRNRARTDDRHVDAHLLAGLRPFRQDPAGPCELAAARQTRHPLEQSVGALRTLDRQDAAAGDRHRLAGVHGAKGLADGKAEHGIVAVRLAQCDRAERPGPRQQVGRHLVHAAHGEAVALEEAHDAREHGVIATGQQAHDERHVAEEAGVRTNAPQVGTPDGTGDHQLPRALPVQGRDHAPDLAPVDPGVREAGDIGVGLALDADDVHGAAAARHALGDLQRQPASARQDADASDRLLRQA